MSETIRRTGRSAQMGGGTLLEMLADLARFVEGEGEENLYIQDITVGFADEFGTWWATVYYDFALLPVLDEDDE